ncbi:FKBP-type peptidyl-prolyl cis-trans isomerase [Aeromicrobium sp.]|nr:FKBP-type peptidyl-prolyl cis-trans isomerase [Candidatus Saccharibacteria bacterium]
MTRKRDRIFAGFGAVLFLLSASAITVVAIITSNSQSDTQTADQNPNTSKCELSASLSAAALPLPEIFKPEGAVSALGTTDLEPGDGAALKSGDCVQVKYIGSLAKDGTVFDQNFDKPTGLQFPLGGGSVIQGWDQGLIGTKIGATRRLVIPATLGYGDQGRNGIPPKSDLVFVVKVLGVTK